MRVGDRLGEEKEGSWWKWELSPASLRRRDRALCEVRKILSRIIFVGVIFFKENEDREKFKSKRVRFTADMRKFPNANLIFSAKVSLPYPFPYVGFYRR